MNRLAAKFRKLFAPHKYGSFVPPVITAPTAIGQIPFGNAPGTFATIPAPSIPVSLYLAKADGKIVTDGAMTNGQATLTCATSQPFTSTAVDGGKPILVSGAGASGADLVTTIVSVTSSSVATLAATAGGTVSAKSVTFGTDNTPFFQNAFNAIAGTGVALQITGAAGSIYCFKSPLACPSNLIVYGAPGVRLAAVIPNTPLTIYQGLLVAQPSGGTVTTVAGSNAVGSASVSITAPPGVGNYLFLQGATSALSGLYRVEAVSGGGPYSVTVDRPVKFAVINTDPAVIYTPSQIVQNVHWLGNGMIISGSGVIRWMFQRVAHCSMRDVQMDAATGNCTDSSLVWYQSFDCWFERVHVDGGGTSDTNQIMSINHSEQCGADRCEAIGGVNHGMRFDGAIACTIRDCISSRNVAGLVVATDTGTAGSYFCRVIGGAFDDNLLGIWVSSGSSFNEFIGFSASYNTAVAAPNAGVYLDGSTGVSYLGSTAMQGNHFSHFSVVNNTASGFYIAAGTKGTVLGIGEISSNSGGGVGTGSDINALDEWTGFGLRIVSSCTAPGINHVPVSGQSCSIDDLIMSYASLGTNAVFYSTTGTCNLSNFRITGIGNGSVGIKAGATVTNLSRGTIVGSAGSNGVWASAGTVRIDATVDLSGCATPLIGSSFAVDQFGANSTANGDTNYTYTYPQYLSETLIDTGALTAGRDRVLPNILGLKFFVKNATTGGFSLTYKVSGQAGVAVAAATPHDIIVCNGTDYERWTAQQ